ncbi:hypothetical protein HAX54_034109 [Datura stramonium]|uniref:Uncharacterized protein n=1 Tax=Datura stramonium TaxID=4076 RepID=A0ABS8VDD2_DATST|nr:hypothetical protein [Datura stramonium]
MCQNFLELKSKEWKQNLEIVWSYLVKAQKQMKKHADKSRCFVEYQVGDKVMAPRTLPIQVGENVMSGFLAMPHDPLAAPHGVCLIDNPRQPSYRLKPKVPLSKPCFSRYTLSVLAANALQPARKAALHVQRAKPDVEDEDAAPPSAATRPAFAL